MSIIKDNSPESEASDIPFANFVKEEAEELAGQILSDAKEKAEQIIRSAHKKKEDILEEAKEEGYQEGYKKGLVEGKESGLEDGREEAQKQVREEMRDELTELSSSLEELLGRFEEQLTTFEKRAKEDILDLVMKIVERIVKTKIEVDSDVVKENVRHAVELCASRSHPTIYIHPDNRSNIEQFAPELEKQFPEMEAITIETDESLAPGGCRVTTETGEVDSDIHTQLEQIRTELFSSHTTTSNHESSD